MNTLTIFDLYNKINALESKVARIEKELEARKFQLLEIQARTSPLSNPKPFPVKVITRSFAVLLVQITIGIVLSVMAYLYLELFFSSLIDALSKFINP